MNIDHVKQGFAASVESEIKLTETKRGKMA